MVGRIGSIIQGSTDTTFYVITLYFGSIGVSKIRYALKVGLFSDLIGITLSFILVYLGDGESTHNLELTWLRDWDRPYNLGDNEFHLAFRVEDFESAHKLHKEMGCICYENKEMGIYFIADPDNYWIEILPANMK